MSHPAVSALRPFALLLLLLLAACGGGPPPDEGGADDPLPPETSPGLPPAPTAADMSADGLAGSSQGGPQEPGTSENATEELSLRVEMIAEAAAPTNSAKPAKAVRTITFGLPVPQDARVLVKNGRPALRVGGKVPFQFTVNDIWPDGSAKWVLGHVVSEVGLGSPHEFVVKRGAGVSKGPNVAIEYADRYVLDTGPMQVDVSKNDFRVFSRVIVDGIQIVKSNHSQGIVGETVDGLPLSLKPGAKVYLEDNGPARAVVRVDGTLVDSNNADVIDVTCRMIAGREQRDVEVILTVRNANVERPGHAFIAHLGVEVAANTGLGRVARVNSPLGLITGDVEAGDDVSAYQAYSKALAFDVNGNGPSYKPPIPKITSNTFEQEGWDLELDGDSVFATEAPEFPENGFANLSGVKGGVTVAIKHMPHFWPASFELGGTGSVIADVWSRRNPAGFAFIWRQHESRTMAFSFHKGPPTDMVEVSRRLDNPVIARAQEYSYYDSTGALPYRLVDVDQQNTVYELLGIDHEVDVDNDKRQVHRFLPASSGGSLNNHSVIERWLMDEFLRHGHGGSLQRALDLALYKAEWQIERSDNFHDADDPGVLVNATADVTENVQADNEHRYREGLIYAFYMTGDTRLREALLDEIEILPSLYVSPQERGMYQTIRALVYLADFIDIVPGAADELEAALRQRIQFFCEPTLDVNTGVDGHGWESAPGTGVRGYFVNSNQVKNEKPDGENYITRGFITGSLGAMALHLAAEYLGPEDPDGMLAAARLKDLATYTRDELFPYHPVPIERKLVYSYGVATMQHLVWTTFDFHSILLAMADGWRITGDVSYLVRGIEFIEAFESRNNLHHLDTKFDNQSFFAAILEYVEENGAVPTVN